MTVRSRLQDTGWTCARSHTVAENRESRASFPDEAAFYAVVTHTSSGSTYVMRYDRTTSEWSMLGELKDSPGGMSAISIAADTLRKRLLVEVVVPQFDHEPGFYVFDVPSRTWQRRSR